MNGVIPATLGKMWEMNLRKNSKIPTDENKNSFVGILLFGNFFIWRFLLFLRFLRLFPDTV